ncbi:MAG: S8 family serine peptidase [Nitrosomonadales bacterium]|nr:S8 family serine peptidase [Nitrosomonadales bacterium]
MNVELKNLQKIVQWHGTHVAGIIARNRKQFLRYRRNWWLTSILPVRVLGKCGGNRSDIIDGMLWAAGIAVPGVPTNPHPAQIINMSLGGKSPGGCSGTVYPEAINQIKAKGALIIVAAGNSNNEAANYVPASCDGVMTVGAVGPYGYRASYSNYSDKYKVDISAPGGDMQLGDWAGIYSTVNSGKTVPEFSTYKYLQGTSMAAPHVSGVASLALALDPQIAPELLAYSLIYGSRAFPSDSQCTLNWPLCGAGVVDAHNTLLAVNALKPFSLVYEYYNVDLNPLFLIPDQGLNHSQCCQVEQGWLARYQGYFLQHGDRLLKVRCQYAGFMEHRERGRTHIFIPQTQASAARYRMIPAGHMRELRFTSNCQSIIPAR